MNKDDITEAEKKIKDMQDKLDLSSKGNSTKNPTTLEHLNISGKPIITMDSKGNFIKDPTVLERLNISGKPITMDSDDLEKQEHENDLRINGRIFLNNLSFISKEEVTYDFITSFFTPKQNEPHPDSLLYAIEKYKGITHDFITLDSSAKYSQAMEILSLCEKANEKFTKLNWGNEHKIFRDNLSRARLILMEWIKHNNPSLKLDSEDKAIDKVEKPDKPNGDDDEDDEEVKEIRAKAKKYDEYMKEKSLEKEDESNETEEDKKAKEKKIIDDLISSREFYYDENTGKIREKWATGETFELDFDKVFPEFKEEHEGD